MRAASAEAYLENRQFPRLDVHCRARIRIGKREYAGFIKNISEGGARIVTLCPVLDLGPVQLRLPDLPPLWAKLRWAEPNGGGISFCLKLDTNVLDEWALAREGTARLRRNLPEAVRQ